MTQYQILDESGDPGFGGYESSSSHFTLAIVQMAKYAPLPELESVRRKFHLSSRFEFKYYKTTPAQKDAFFEAVQKIPFRVRAIVIEKDGLDKRFKEMSGQDFVVEFIARLTLRASELDIANHVLIIDGATKPLCRALRIKLSTECRIWERVRPFKKIVGGKSKNEDGLQLADMLVGAIRNHGMGIDSGYYKTFANKVVDLWEVPERRT